jgi:hypothetical protein
VTTSKIRDGAVTEPKLATGAVSTNKLADNSIITSKIQNNQITEGKMASGAVNSRVIANQAVQAQHIDPALFDPYPDTAIWAKFAQVESDFVNDSFFGNDILLIPSYNGFLPNSQLELYVSNDARNFYNVNNQSLYISTTGKQTFDYSIMYKNGYYYIIYDYDKNNVGSGSGIGIIKTQDFVNFSEYQISIPSQYIYTWAPEWLLDGSSTYILISLSDGTTTTDINGNTVKDMRTYYMKATDDTLTSFGTPTIMNVDSTTRIDPYVIKVSGTYHMFIKNEYSKVIDHFTNSAIETAGSWTFVQTLSYSLNVEAPSVIYFNGLFRCFVDAYTSGFALCKTSTDLLNWSSEFRVGPDANITTRHFTTLVVSDVNQKKSIQDLTIRLNKKTMYKTNSNDIGKEKSLSIPYARVNLYSLATAGVISSLVVEENTEYYVGGSDHVTINSIDISNLGLNKQVFFSLNTNQSSSYLIIKTGSNVLLPGNRDFKLSKDNNNNETLIPFVNYNALLKPISLTNTEYNSNLPVESVDLNTLAVGGIISSLVVQKNVVYYVGGSAQVTINSINSNAFAKGQFYFCVQSAGNAKITIKNGGGVALPGGIDFNISTLDGNNEYLYSVIKFNNSLRILK